MAKAALMRQDEKDESAATAISRPDPNPMTDLSFHQIWNPATGITDIDAEPQSLGASAILGIRAVWADERERLKGTRRLSEFTDRLSREWAIETGVIENLYDIERGVTQTLIERGFQAELLSQGSTNRPREFVLRLLRDQKEALDGVFDFVSQKRNLSVSYIKELHAALLRSQDFTDGVDARGRAVELPLIRGDWKTQPNYPERDGVVYAYCPPEQVASEMDRLISLHADHIAAAVPSEVQAAWLHHRFAQIHPFQDGNGRVARAVASLVLVRDGLFPLVVTRDDKAPYIDALEAGDAGDIQPLVDLIAKLQIVQFRKATAVSEAVRARDSDVKAMLGELIETAGEAAAKIAKPLENVFKLAYVLEGNVTARLDEISPDVTSALQRVRNSGSAFVKASTTETAYHFRSQVIENAKNHLHYFVDTATYRSWIALNMKWTRFARLVFAIHGIGKPFNGSLICAPFLEFRDTDDDGQARSALVPVADEGLVFFFNETQDRLMDRFVPWREAVIKVALRELIQGL